MTDYQHAIDQWAHEAVQTWREQQANNPAIRSQLPDALIPLDQAAWCAGYLFNHTQHQEQDPEAQYPHWPWMAALRNYSFQHGYQAATNDRLNNQPTNAAGA